MRYIKKTVPMRTRHSITHQEYTSDEVEALIGVGTGIAIAPINPDKHPGATFATCDHWILMHLESGLYIGEPFPAHEAFAKTYLEEVNQIEEIHLNRSVLDAEPSKKRILWERIRQIRQLVDQRFLYQQETLF
jgi:hypothetical protein